MINLVAIILQTHVKIDMLYVFIFFAIIYNVFSE
jgi:hypothetical protein